MKIIFWTVFFIIVYVYIGYPCFLILVTKLKKVKPVQKKYIYPHVSLIIPAYNEEKIIKKRIENILSLTYPKDKLEVIIASDASIDKTDEVIMEYKNRGVISNRQPQRKGKMATVNDSVNKATGEILVFSDADILFKEDDIEKLVCNFADPNVGCVVGIKKIVIDEKATSPTEDLYWKYELFIKQLEGKTGSVAAGSSGCNFALRKDLYTQLEDKTTAEDLALPLICISRGFRVVFEPEAVSYERLLPGLNDEFQRKIRLVMGGLHAISIVKNRLRLIDKFTLFKLFSHKILRWSAPFLLLGLFIINWFLKESIYYLLLLFQVAFYFLALAGLLLQIRKIKLKGLWSKFFDLPLYFTSMNLAGFIGVLGYSLKMHKGWTAYNKISQKMA